MRAQVEASFSWVFVLIAGLAFLLLFFGLVRSCTDTGTATINAANVRDATSRLSTLAWEGDAQVNITLPDAAVSCPGGALTLLAQDGSASPLDRAPIYLPPAVGGRSTAVTRELAIAQGPSPFLFGSVVYVLDERTTYVIVQDLAGLADRLMRELPSHPSLRSITLGDLERQGKLADLVPSSSRTVVILTVGNEVDLARVDTAGLPAGIDVRGVSLVPTTQHGGRATFYRADANGDLIVSSRAPYAHELIGLGMIIAADAESSRCATTEVSRRARTIARIAADRAAEIAPEVIDPQCALALNDAAMLLDGVASLDGDAAFLDAFVGAENRLLSIQGTLLSRPGGCPGVA